MLEKKIEAYLRDKVKSELKGVSYKFTSPNRRAVPDRICVVSGYTFYVECKATGKSLTEAQEREARRLRDLDQWVYMVDSKSSVDKLISFWKARLRREEGCDAYDNK